MDENLLRDALKDLQKYILHRPLEEMVILRSGEQFEENKDRLLQDMQTGAKRFSYPAIRHLGRGRIYSILSKI